MSMYIRLKLFAIIVMLLMSTAGAGFAQDGVVIDFYFPSVTSQ